MIGTMAHFIPRYNWDYRLPDLSKALMSLAGRSNMLEDALSGALNGIFGHEPVLTTSGRASLWAILKSLGIPEGSRIGVPLFCCPVVFEVIREAGFIPEFLDIREDSYTVSAEDIARKSGELAAVVVVHMFGNPADMAEICAASGKIPIIEDCAQALFSRRGGRLVGFDSNASFFSFRSGKYISAGEGSAIFTANDALLSSLRRIVDRYDTWSLPGQLKHCVSTYGKSLFYRRPLYGLFGRSLGTFLDSRLNLTAKSGISLKKIAGTDARIIADRLPDFQARVDQQRSNALKLLSLLSGLEVGLPRERPSSEGNFYQFIMRFGSSNERDFMCSRLAYAGVDTARYLDDVVETARGLYGYTGDCSVSETCSRTILSIPHYYTLSGSIDAIAEAIADAHRSYRSLSKRR